MIFHYLAWPFAAAKVHIIFHMTKNYIKKKQDYPFLFFLLYRQYGVICKENFEFKWVNTRFFSKELSYIRKNAKNERSL